MSISYSENDTCGYSFSVVAGYGKGGVGYGTTQLYSHNYYCCIDGGDFVAS